MSDLLLAVAAIFFGAPCCIGLIAVVALVVFRDADGKVRM